MEDAGGDGGVERGEEEIDTQSQEAGRERREDKG